MKLPNVQQAQIESAKITGYLLSTEHPEGGGKAKFFSEFGFSIDSPEYLERALLNHCLRNEAIEVIETEYGVKHIVDGAIETPDGLDPYVRTVWQVDAGKDYPRFITAYPLD